MIEFVPFSGEPEAANCPAVVCDTCRKQVVEKGNIHWVVKVRIPEGEPREQSPVFAAHKGKCDRALETWLRQQYGEGWIYLWDELGTFLRQLNFNVARDFEQDPEGEYHQTIIRQPKNNPHNEIPPV